MVFIYVNSKPFWFRVWNQGVLDSLAVTTKAWLPCLLLVLLLLQLMSVLQILYIQFDIHGQSFTSVTPPRSATTPQADVSLAHLMQHDDIHVQSFTSEQIKETFDVARNSIELLSVFFNAAGCVKGILLFVVFYCMLPFWLLSFELTSINFELKYSIYGYNFICFSHVNNLVVVCQFLLYKL